jgi:hypothetical protein
MSFDDPFSDPTRNGVIPTDLMVAGQIGRGGNSGGPDITVDPTDASGGGLSAIMHGVGPLATLFGTGLSAFGTVQKNHALADSYRADAENMALQITANTNQAFAEEKVRNQKLTEVLASQTAIQASRNVVDDSGSAQAVAKRSQTNSDFENTQMWFQTNTRNAQITAQQASLRTKADEADSAANISAAAAGVKGVSQLGSALSSIGSLASGVGSIAGLIGGAGKIGDEIGVVGSAVGEAASSAGSAIASAASDVVDSAGSFLGDIGSTIADFFDW